MPKVKISEYSATANSNTDVASINIDEGCAPSGINNAIRAVMGHLKDFQQGTNGDPFNGPVNGTLGATTASTANVTTLTTSSTITHNGGTANGVAYLNGSKVLTTGSALVFDGTNLSLGTVGAKVNFATTGSATVNYVGGSADGYSLEMVMQRGASQPLKYKQDYGVGHVWSIAGSDKMTLDASGNLGVGTTSPSTRLHLKGASGTTTLRLEPSSSTSIYTQVRGANGDLYLEADPGNAEGSSSMLFTVDGTERARIDSSGNLLVGTTSGGSQRILAYRNVSSTTKAANGIYWGGSNGAGADAHLQFTDSAAYNYYFGGNNGGAYVMASSNGVRLSNGGTSWASDSDERLKDIIEPITDAVVKVSTLRAVIGKYKTDEDGKRRAFLIAQDVQAVLPEAVFDEQGMLMLAYTETIPLLVAAIQEQQSLITTLTARITALESA
jgi:hypothetical protein